MVEPKRRPLSKRDPAGDLARCGHHGGLRKNGTPCVGLVVKGTHRCRMHGGKPITQLRREGAIVVELNRWSLGDSKVEPGEMMLRLVSQSARRVDLYSDLLRQAYEAADRLQAAHAAQRLVFEADDYDDGRPKPDVQTAAADLRRIFGTGGLAALIGYQYDATKDGDIYATKEAIRGLVDLEMSERKFCADLCAKAIAAGIAERMVRLAERQGALMAQFVARVAERLGLSLEQAALLPAAIEAEVINMTEGIAA